MTVLKFIIFITENIQRTTSFVTFHNLTFSSLFATKSDTIYKYIIILNKVFTLNISKVFETVTIATNYCNK